MTGETVLVPGGRDVRATLDDRGGDRIVVACPPHPRHGGNRSDGRLRAVSDALAERGVDCLRVDYGDWDEGRGERTDATRACRWARERFGEESVGLFGYSFGGAVALLAAAADEPVARDLRAVVALAPGAGITGGVERPVDEALADIDAPVRVVYGSRDTTADWEPIVERARELGLDVVELSADHHFVGQAEKAAGRAAEFLLANLD